MRPLRKPQIGMPAGHGPGHRKVIDVGYAIDPDCLRPHQTSEPHTEKPRCRARRDNEIRPLPHNYPSYLNSETDDSKLAPAICVIYAIEPMFRHLGAVAFQHSDKRHFI